jgi:GDP-L-fucose synthase
MDKTARTYVAGHRGLVGSAILRLLRAEGYQNLIVRTRSELHLGDAPSLKAFFAQEQPE